jgi:hypothetical protein
LDFTTVRKVNWQNLFFSTLWPARHYSTVRYQECTILKSYVYWRCNMFRRAAIIRDQTYTNVSFYFYIGSYQSNPVITTSVYATPRL